jgi:serine/threonine-protein kinase/endoribonuclease IRE1
VYDHPREYGVALTPLGLPLRPGQNVCAFYVKTGACKYGPQCRFHHPHVRPIFAGTAAAPSTPENVPPPL